MILGVDIGDTEIRAGLVSESGELIRAARVPMPNSLARFGYEMRALIGPLAVAAPRGIGIGCKGLVNPQDTQVESPPGALSYLEGRYLAEFLPANLPIYCDNDARAALAGEVAWGAAHGRGNALLFTLGASIGGAVLADGRILRGATGVAGHLGHYTVDPLGPLCACGNTGCLETYFSARAIESEAAALVHRGAASPWAANPKCEEVFRAAAAGDASAHWIVDRAIRCLEGAIAGLAMAFDPEIVILGGPIAAAGDVLLVPLASAVASRTRLMLRRVLPVVRSQLGDATGVIGAAALAVAPQRSSRPAG